MSMNRYGVIARRHWARWLPRQYAAISDPESFFTTLGEEVARQIDDLTDELVGEIRRSDSYRARVSRLFAARAIAGELILPGEYSPEWSLPPVRVIQPLKDGELVAHIQDRNPLLWRER